MKTTILKIGILLLLFSACSKDDGPKPKDPDPIQQPDPEPDPENQAPGSFELLTPVSDAEDETRTPTFTWEQATDPDGDTVTYDLYVDTEENPATLIAEGLSTTSYEMPGNILDYKTEYHWNVVAKDSQGSKTPSETKLFSTDKIRIEWQVSLGGSKLEGVNSIQHTLDGGYILAGYSVSSDGDVSSNEGSGDMWIVKLDMAGGLMWEHSVGGNLSDAATTAIEMPDGNFTVLGSVETISTQSDYMLLRMSADLMSVVGIRYGGSELESPSDMIQTVDGGFLLAGGSYSNDENVSSNNGFSDYWIVKVTEDVGLQWEKNFGGSGSDVAKSIIETDDGGYLVAGHSTSTDGDVTVGNKGDQDVWILKLDAMGNIMWQKGFGGLEDDELGSVVQTADGGFILAGYSTSSDGDVGGNKGKSDYWITKLDADGNLLWEKNFGGSGNDEANQVLRTFDGGYIVAGYAVSADGDVGEPRGDTDYWILKLDADGNLVWEENFGGTGVDSAQSILQTSDGGFVVAGFSDSSDGDVNLNKGESDIWVIKLK